MWYSSPMNVFLFIYVFNSVSAQSWVIGRPGGREADTGEPGCNTLLFFNGAPLRFCFKCARVQQWYIGPRFKVSSERLENLILT